MLRRSHILEVAMPDGGRVEYRRWDHAPNPRQVSAALGDAGRDWAWELRQITVHSLEVGERPAFNHNLPGFCQL